MKFSNRKQSLPGFQIAPMLDVVFLLLCFFMATSVYSQWESSVNIRIPTADSASEARRLPGEIIVNVDSQGTIVVNQVTLTPEQLTTRCRAVVARFPGQAVAIRADKDARWEHVMAAIDACIKADVWNLDLSALHPGTANGSLPEPPPATLR